MFEESGPVQQRLDLRLGQALGDEVDVRPALRAALAVEPVTVGPLKPLQNQTPHDNFETGECGIRPPACQDGVGVLEDGLAGHMHESFVRGIIIGGLRLGGLLPHIE